MFAQAALRTFDEVNIAMTRVYQYMFLAVLASMGTAYYVSITPALMAFFFTGVMTWVTILSPLLFIFLVPVLFNSGISKSGMIATLLAFASVMGLSMAALFAAYTAISITQAFMGAAVLFLTMTLYGYTTQKSLESWGSFLLVGLIAVIVVSLINLFIGSSVLAMAVSVAAVLVFLGLTAYDTQRIKEQIAYSDSPAVEVYGALTLYLDFINLFIHLVQLFGQRK
jgi:FtsH-binding integral membrane protein